MGNTLKTLLRSRDLAVNWDEGGMPWTCLPGEPSDVNWCNDPGGWDLYKNPPKAWRGANDHGKHAPAHPAHHYSVSSVYGYMLDSRMHMNNCVLLWPDGHGSQADK